jgi:hypothetical protein
MAVNAVPRVRWPSMFVLGVTSNNPTETEQEFAQWFFAMALALSIDPIFLDNQVDWDRPAFTNAAAISEINVPGMKQFILMWRKDDTKQEIAARWINGAESRIAPEQDPKAWLDLAMRNLATADVFNTDLAAISWLIARWGESGHALAASIVRTINDWRLRNPAGSMLNLLNHLHEVLLHDFRTFNDPMRTPVSARLTYARGDPRDDQQARVPRARTCNYCKEPSHMFKQCPTLVKAWIEGTLRPNWSTKFRPDGVPEGPYRPARYLQQA